MIGAKVYEASGTFRSFKREIFSPQGFRSHLLVEERKLTYLDEVI